MWKEERKLQSLTLKYQTPEHITRCHWQKSENVKYQWAIYRGIVGIIFFATIVYTAPINVDAPKNEIMKYFIFLTHWTYLLEGIQFLLAFVIVAKKWYLEKKEKTEPLEFMPWYYKLYWALYNTVLSSSIAVSVIFWAAIYKPGLFPANAPNLILHGFNSLIMIVDFILVGHPIRILHFYFPVVYGLVYALFSFIYQTAGGTGICGQIPIYSILDWREPGKAILTCFLSMIFLIVVHSIFGLLSMLKLWAKKKKSSQTT